MAWNFLISQILLSLSHFPSSEEPPCSLAICWHLCYYVGEGNGNPLQYSCLENPMDEGAWWAAVHGVAKSRTRLSDFTFTFHFPALEKEMATHTSVLAWRIPGMGEPRGLTSLGSHRVGHDWSDLAAVAADITMYKWLEHQPLTLEFLRPWLIPPRKDFFLSSHSFLLEK